MRIDLVKIVNLTHFTSQWIYSLENTHYKVKVLSTYLSIHELSIVSKFTQLLSNGNNLVIKVNNESLTKELWAYHLWMDVIKECFRFGYVVIDAKTTIITCYLLMLFLFCENLSNDIKHCNTVTHWKTRVGIITLLHRWWYCVLQISMAR